MAVAAIYVLHGIQTPNNFYSQISNHSLSPAVRQMINPAAGYPDPLFRGVQGSKPMLTFSTTQVNTLLGESGIRGVDLSSGDTYLWYRKAANKGSRVSLTSDVHYRFLLNDAFMYWRSIRAGNQGMASAEVTICGVYDGTNPPIVPIGTGEPPASSSEAESFGLGPVEINGDAYTGIQEASLELGWKLYQVSDQSDPWDTFIGQQEIDPVFTAHGVNPGAWLDYGIVGAAMSSLSFYLRARNLDAAGGAAYIANGDSNHILLSADQGLITVETSTGGDNKPVDTALKIGLEADEVGDDPLTIATGVAIS